MRARREAEPLRRRIGRRLQDLVTHPGYVKRRHDGTTHLPAIPDLLETTDNPAPPGCRLATVVTTDGVAVRTAVWAGRAPEPKGCVLIMQGRAEFIEKYFEIVGELLDRGFAVATFDWRGQGGSARALADGRKGHVRHFDDFRHDLEAVQGMLRKGGLPGPVFGLAHSMGGCIALTGAAEGWLNLRRLVVSAPMVGLSLVRRPGIVRLVARMLGALGMGARFVPGGPPHSISTEPFAGNRLSRDERRYARNAAVAAALGEGAIGAPTIGWLTAAYEAMERLQTAGYGARIRIPTLVLGAGDDPVCSAPAAEAFSRALGTGSYVLIPEARHEIMMEGDAIRAAFWRAFDDFVPGSGDAGRDAASAAEHSQEIVVETGIA